MTTIHNPPLSSLRTEALEELLHSIAWLLDHSRSEVERRVVEADRIECRAELEKREREEK